MRTMEETARSRAAGLSLEDALERFVIQLQADGRSVHTIGQYRRNILLLERWLVAQGRSDKVEEVDHEVLARFLVSPEARVRADGAEKKATSTNGLRTSLRVFFGYVHAVGWTRKNAARLVRRARCGTAPPRSLSEEEQRRLLETLAAGTGWVARRDHAMFHLMLATGIRVGSVVALRTEDVDTERGELWLHSTKGSSPGLVFLGPGIREHLRTWMEGQLLGELFQGRSGRRLSTRQVARRLSGWLDDAGITRAASPHSLRHSFAVALYGQTGDLVVTKEALLHRSIASTLKYLGRCEVRVRRAVDRLSPAMSSEVGSLARIPS